MSIILESIEDSKDKQVYTVREKELLHELRVLLKDTPNEITRTLNTLVEEQRGERWTDTSLLIYLNQCMADINCEPAQTNYDLNNFPEPWKACVINGAMIMALISEGVLQVGEQFSYSDAGISLNVNLSQGYQSMAQMLLNGYIEMRKNIKRAMRPHAAGLKTGAPAVKIRSYAPRQWVYR
jgi:hypothetical protein